ncbi:MAG TPA: DsbA family protein [Longimicrobium sp.]|jgi:predicted DsbA family dithiol-disulfide isomerase
MAAVPVVVFSDFTCPFSYVTEAVLRRLEGEGLAAPAYAAFELYPAPAPLPPPDAAPVEAARPLAEAAGVELRPPAAGARTRKAHEAAKFAGQRGVEREMREALFAAYFRDGRDVGRIDVLVELGAALGLDLSELKAVLDVDGMTAEVERDEALARRAGVTATPVLLVGQPPKIEVLAGAQGYRALREALERAAEG